MVQNQVTTSIPLERAEPDLRASTLTTVRKGLWWLRLMMLLSVDFTLLSIAWVLVEYRTFYAPNPWYTLIGYWPLMLITVFIQIVALAVQGTYQENKDNYDFLNIIKTLTFAHGLILIFCILCQPIVDVTRSTLISSWLLSTSLVCTGRLGVNVTTGYLRKIKKIDIATSFIICDPEEEEKILSFLEKDKKILVLGSASSRALDRYNRQETLDKLNQLGVTEVFVSSNAMKNRMFVRWLFQASGIRVHLLLNEFKSIYKGAQFNLVGDVNCISFDSPIITGKDFWIKRSIDFCVAATLVILLFPIYAAIAIAIKLDSPGPVFYRQTRIGLRARQFKVWKFRTMVVDAERLQKDLEASNEIKDGIIFKIKHDPRITRIGNFLRRYSLDELPQLFNVLLGEMSLVGPRPLPTRDVDKFSERHFIRQEVLPGITGLWQVSGRSDVLDFEQVINLDLKYIEHWSLRLDFEILLRTVSVVLKKEGAY